jgi:hypothetical protein
MEHHELKVSKGLGFTQNLTVLEKQPEDQRRIYVPTRWDDGYGWGRHYWCKAEKQEQEK